MKSNFGLELKPKKTTETSEEKEFEDMLIKSGAKGSYMVFQGFLQDEIPKHLRVIDENAKQDLLPKWIDNFKHNLQRFKEGLRHGIRHRFDIPAVIVGAGPSLEKNKHLLSKLQEKADIFSTDRASQSLDFEPDFIVTVDADEKIRNYYSSRIHNSILPATCSPNLNPKGLQFWYIPSIDPQTDRILQLMSAGLSIIQSYGNVGATACSIADYLGYKEIILVGMDLAYNEGTPYEQMDWYNKLKEAGGEEMAKKAHRIIEHKAWGTKCISDPLFDSYRLAFNQFLSKTKCKIISAVEGGSIEHPKLEYKKLEDVLS